MGCFSNVNPKSGSLSLNITPQNSPKLSICSARTLSEKTCSFHNWNVNNNCNIVSDIDRGHEFKEADTER